MSEHGKDSLKVIDISGYSFTGKSAVYDLVTEFDGYYSHSKEFEFDLIRIQGGILDLQSALTDNWSPIRSSEAIRNFFRLIRAFGGDKSFFSKLTSTGAHYDYFFPGFSDSSKNYINSLINARWMCEWPFALYNNGQGSVLTKKIASKLGHLVEEEVYLSRMSVEEFIGKTQKYFDDLFSGIAAEPFKCLVLNNSFEPFAPEKSIAFFNSAKSIVVDRDPRDIYLSALTAGKIAGANVGKAVTAGSVENFIDRFRIYRGGIDPSVPNVYRTNFEKIILDYDVEVDNIRKFLCETTGNYPGKGSVFNPVLSRKNIRLWETVEDIALRKEIMIIKSELNDYCLEI